MVLVALAGLSAVGYVISIASSAPPLNSLKPRELGSQSEVRAADGTRLGFIQSNELRRPVEGNQIPKSLKDATVAIEDERYYHHKGVDYAGIVRAAVKNLSSHKTVQGGSTITMQLVRNLYISKERTYQRKIREAKLAEELENEHTKEWILDKYLNTVPYGTLGGQTAVGVQAAARVYFGKPVSKLSLRESAMLAGLPQAPSSYSPVRDPEKAEARRNEVLAKMAQLKMITPEKAAATEKRGLGVHTSRYFTSRRESFFFDYVKDELIKEYGIKTVRQGGLRVDTTIDLKKQQQARAAINGRLAGVGPSSAIVTIDPKNGYIKAMASSADYGKSKFNLAAQGHRQPGSTFKVMALMTALRKGVDPRTTTYVSKPLKFTDPTWGPIDVQTYGHDYSGSINLEQATLKSDNTVYEQLALDLGPPEIKQTAYDMGIKTHLDGYPAEALGGLTLGVSPLEMADAYATIASGGYRNRPTAIKKITFPDGKPDLPRRFKVKRTKAFEDWVTAEATRILVENVKGGTGTRANIGCPAGGKTGTTDSFNDAWFVGFTPRLATAVWVGYPNAQIEMTTEYHGGSVAGGTFPAEIWSDYMKQAKGKFCGDFKPAKTAAHFSPFFGKYARGGGPSTGDTSTQDTFGNPITPSTGTTTPTTPAPTTPGTGTGTGTGKKDKGKFNPDLYESPPQGPPAAKPPASNDPGGGATAPTG
ncbi:MAG: transglycosylase domain-containing protein [Solirubrobacteraceae bacterium]